MKIDIHNYANRAETAFNRLEKRDICDANKRHIRQFADYCITDGMSIGRVVKYINTITYWAEWIGKDFDTVTKVDIVPVVTKIQINERYSAWTKKDYKILFKRFYKWLKKAEEYPAEVKWISGRMKLCDTKLPGEGDMLSEEDVKRVLDVIDHPRDKALVAMLWESGCRIGELCSLRLSNIQIDKYGVLITVSGKTGSRKLRLISSTEYLMVWLKMHPGRDDRNVPLWVKLCDGRKPLCYTTVNSQLRRYFALAGVKKRCNPHIFRHSRATYLANHLTEFQMNQYFGWKQGSDMPSTYVHLSGKELEGAILELNGIKEVEKRDRKVTLRPKKCPRCDMINSYDSKYCGKCAGVLDVREAMEMQVRHESDLGRLSEQDELLEKLASNPEIVRMLVQKLREVGNVDERIRA